MWVTTKVGTPKGGLPPHPLVMSNVLRPVTNAPILVCASRRSSALCGETPNTISVPGSLYSVSPLEYHAKSRSPPSPSGDPGPSFGPAMKPSSDIDNPVETFPMFMLLPFVWSSISRTRPGTLLARRPVGEREDARAERPRVHELQGFPISAVLEEALPATQDHGMNHEPELVEEPVA